MLNATYVYAIVPRETPLPAELTGLDGAALVSVPWHDLAAVTTPSESGERCPTAEGVLQHETVVEALGREGSTLPVRFGTILRDPNAVAQALAERYEALVADLARVGDKVELGLTVLWAELGAEGKGLDVAHDSLPSSREASAMQSAGLRYLRARLAEYRQDAALRKRARVLAQDLDERLHACTVESRCTILPTPRLALRATYLLNPSQVSTFRTAFETIQRAHPDARFLLSGPWPPYSFVTAAGTAAGSTLSRQIQAIGRLYGAEGAATVAERS